MKLVWILFLALSALCKEISWDEYKEKYKLNFENTEEALRRKIFEENVQKIEAENAKGHTYKLAINHFAHWTKKELKAMFMTPKQVNVVQEQEDKFEKYSADDEETPSGDITSPSIDVDWRRNGYVTSVKNQGPCGACYTFATTANLESIRAMKKNVLEDLSPQQVLDCSYNFGCIGGNGMISYFYLMYYGSMPWSSYPYEAKKGPCKYNKYVVVAYPRYFLRVSGGRDKQLVASVIKRPTTVNIHAHVHSFLFYSSGIYNDPLCTSNVTDHMAMVVGVIRNRQDNYYILKNSWGTDWGMNGYMNLGKTRKNPCGIASNPSYLVML